LQKTLLLVIIILGPLFFGSFSVAFGEMMSSPVGVGRGDVFRYNYTCYFNSNDPNSVPPASFSWINQTNYFMINVTEVSDSSISFNTMLLGFNGSSSIGVCSMNVGTGMASISGYAGPTDANNFYFMARNVGMMGRMFPSSLMSPTINGTLMMNYAGGSRLTNHLTTSTNQNGATVNSDYYFDQATGMMAQWRQESVQTSGHLQTTSTQMMKIISSSLWAIPEFPTSSIILSFIAVATVSAIIVSAKAKFKRLAQTNQYITVKKVLIK
jgi:hypothetical protein